MGNKVYPAFYESQDGSVYLYQNKNGYYSYIREEWDKSSPSDAHGLDKNITAEYLANTYGEVKSKEHAEFIKLLAETNDIPCGHKVVNDDCKYFYVIEECLFFAHREIDVAGSYKQITIPLPPECESASDGEWPKVNDDVRYKDAPWKVVSLYKHVALLTHDDAMFEIANISELQKPKTPEQELLDELHAHFEKYTFADQAINELPLKYNITKKGEGDGLQ